MPDIHRALVVTKASLKSNWHRECKKWLVRDLSVGIADGDCFPTTDIVIINYDLLRKYPKSLAYYWDIIILDECHHIKNRKTARAKAVIGYRPTKKELAQGMVPTSGLHARRRLALSGSPMENRPEELWTTLYFLDPERWKSYYGYAVKYCGGRSDGWGFNAKGASNLDGLQRVLRSTCMIRRLKKDVLKELPPKTRVLVELESEDGKAALKAEREVWERHEDELVRMQAALELAKVSDNAEAFKEAVAQFRKESAVAFTEVSRVRHETALAKLPAVIQAIKEDLDEVQKILVFAHHLDVLKAIHAEFERDAVLLTGESSQDERDAAVTRFQTDASCRLFVGSIRAAGEGLNLQAASLVGFAEEDWNPSKLSQCEDRCVLEGQPVLTACGWQPVESIVAGDRVVGRDGLLHFVTDVWSRQAKGANALYTKAIVELECCGWCEPIKVTSDHRVLTKRGWVVAGDLRLGDQILMPSGYDGEAMGDLAFDYDCRVARTITQGAHMRSNRRWKPKTTFKNGRLVVMPERMQLGIESLFVFGYYIGDGFSGSARTTGKFVSFSGHRNQKATHLHRCKAWAASLGCSGTVYDQKDSFGSELRVWSAELSLWFTKHFGRTLFDKQNPKRLPEWVFGLSRDQRAAMLEGMLASDGYMRKPPKGAMRYEYVTASKRLAADAARLMMGLGLKPCCTIGSKGQHSIQFTLGQEQVLQVREVKMRFPKHGERVYDITVDGAESFVIGTAVVHNCHRIGHKGNVLVKHWLLAGSLDAKMIGTIVDKQAIIDRALDDEKSVLIGEPVLVPKAPQNGSRKHLEDDGLLITSEQCRAILRGLQMLSGVCDGALRLDGAGFNKVDQRVGHELAQQNWLSPRQAALGRRIVSRYKVQVGQEVVDAMYK